MAGQSHTSEKHITQERATFPIADSNGQTKSAFSPFADEKNMLACWSGLALMGSSQYLSTERLKIHQMLKVREIMNNIAYPELIKKSDNQNRKRVKRVIGLQEALKELLLEDLNDPNEREDMKFFEALGLILIRKDHPLRPRAACYCSVDKRVVPVGPMFQAQTPDCKPADNRKDDDAEELKWLGTQVWPPPNEGLEVNVEDIGKGRPEGCLCKNAGSAECVRLHVSEARALLQSQIGQAFSSWKFDEMGETFSESLTEKEEEIFKSLLTAHPLFDHGTEFWKFASKHIPNKSRKTLINYYYNVHNPRWTGSETRSKLCEIDGDNDNAEEKQNKEWLKIKARIHTSW